MKRGLVIGGAACLDADLALVGGVAFDVRIGINDALYTFRDLDAVATLHPEHVPRWSAKRAALGWPAVLCYSFHRPECGVEVWHPEGGGAPWWLGGSSGLYAVGVALHALGAGEVWLAGVPMDAQPNRYRDEEGWAQFQRYRGKWEKVHAAGWLSRVRSLSGWTQTLLGAPDVCSVGT